MRPYAPALVAAAAALVPTTADAAQIRVGTPCVINTESAPGDIPITGSGFAPNSPLSIFTDGNAAIVPSSPGFEAPPELTATSDAAGAMSYVLRTPVGPVRRTQTVRLRVVDAAGTAAETSYKAVIRSVVVPRRTTAGRPVAIRGYGFPGRGAVRLFWEFRGRIRYTATLGRGAGPCGNVPARRFSVLERRDPDGVWRIGAGQSADPADVSYVFRVRKRGTRVTDMGPES